MFKLGLQSMEAFREMIVFDKKELFPRTIVMDEGQVVADGLTMEILENEELLTAHGLEKP